MPLSKPLTELLATLPDEAARKILAENFEKFPQLQEAFAGNLRQNDYDRLANAQKVELSEVARVRDENARKAAQWQDWADKNIPIHKQLVDSHKAIAAERDQLAEQIRIAAEAANAGGGDEMVNRAELAATVNQRLAEYSRNNGAPTATQVQQIVAQEAAKLAEGLERKFLQETFPASMNTVLQTANLQIKFSREFPGEEMDPMAFMQFMADRHAAAPTKELYEEFTRPQREKLSAIAHKKEIDDAVAAGVKQALSQQNVPGSSTNGNGNGVNHEFGHIQLRKAAVPEDKGGLPNMPADLDLGSNQAALAAAADLRSAGKF